MKEEQKQTITILGFDPIYPAVEAVEVKRITKKQHYRCLRYDTKVAAYRFHLSFNYKSHQSNTPICFPHLGCLTVKDTQPPIEWLSHYTPFRSKSEKVVCVFIVSDGITLTYWRAPDHEVGNCPFIMYPDQGQTDKKED